MSAYTKIKTSLRDADGIKHGLEKLFPSAKVLMNMAGLQLKGWPGHTDPMAQIAVRKEDLAASGKSVYGDIGFQLQKDGTYQFCVNDMDTRKFSENWMDDLKAYHNETIATKKLAAVKGKVVRRTESRNSAGRLQIQLAAR